MDNDWRVCNSSCPFFQLGKKTERRFCYYKYSSNQIIEVGGSDNCLYNLNSNQEIQVDDPLICRVAKRIDENLSDFVGENLESFTEGQFSYTFRPDLHKKSK